MLQVIAAAFEFGGERAVYDEGRLSVENRSDGVHIREDTMKH